MWRPSCNNESLPILKREAKRLDGERKEFGVADAIADIEGLTPAAMVALGKANVKSVEDLADLASDELQEALKDVAKMIGGRCRECRYYAGTGRGRTGFTSRAPSS